MRLVTLDRAPDGRAGVVLGDDVLDIGMAGAVFPLARLLPASLTTIISAGDEGIDLLRRLTRRVADASDAARQDLRHEGALTALHATRLRAPIPRPGILLSHGRAYHSHVQEMAGTAARAPDHPIGFMKNVNAIIGHGAPILLPDAAPHQVDFEAEISVVFSRPCHGVTKETAMHHVLGFTIVNDVSARDWVPQMGKHPDLNRMGKQFASFAPMGPWITTLDEIADPHDLHLQTRVNGQVMQDAWTRDLIWSLPELIAYYAAWHPFQAGDVLTTGTPSGVGYGREPKVFLQPGDTVSISVEGVGELANPVIASPSAVPAPR